MNPCNVSQVCNLLQLDVYLRGVYYLSTFWCEFYVRPSLCYISDPSLQLHCFTQVMVDKGSYYYTDQMLSLNSTSTNTSHHLISYLSLSANSPLILSQWQHELHHHPGKRHTKYILQGIEEGFKLGFSDSQILQPSTSNLSTPNPSVITDYLAKEVFLNRMWKYPPNAAPRGFISVQ